MKKKVYREMYREIYGIDVQKEREIMDNLWARKVKAAAKEMEKEKTTKKVKTANVTKIDENIPYTLTNKKKAGK